MNLLKRQLSPLDYDAPGGPCVENMNGLKQSALFNSRCNITDYPTQATMTTSKNKGQLTGSYTCTADKEFQVLILDHEVSDVKIEGQGAGFGPFKVSAKLFVRGTRDEIEGFCAQAQYDEMVFILPQTDGVRRPIGNEDFPARCMAKFDSKTVSATDPRGLEFEITSYSKYPERLLDAVTVPVIS